MEFCAFKTFDQVPKKNGQIFSLDQIFQSTEKSQKIRSTDYESFDQLKKPNFDQVNLGQTTPCPLTECRKVLCYFLHFWQVNSYFLHCFVLGLFFSHILHNFFSTAILKTSPLLLVIIRGHLFVVCYLFLRAKVN